MRGTISVHREAFIIRRSEPSKDLKCIRPKGRSGDHLSRHLALWYLGTYTLTTSYILVFPSLALNRLYKGPSILLSKP
jgi:hypothetical protein